MPKKKPQEIQLKSFSDLKGNELLWKQMKFGADHFVLHQGNDCFAELYWTRLFSDEAVGRITDRWWILDRRGWMRDHVVAENAGSDDVVAAFEFDWMKNGIIRLENGRTFEWYRTRTFSSAFCLAESEGRGFFTIEHGFHRFRQQAWIELHFPSSDLDLPLLMCMSMYLIHCINLDAAAVVGAVSATVG